MLLLHVQAEFGAFRNFVAGSYRSSAPFITPSGAYGLLLNIAGIESRLDDGEALTTRMRTAADLPSASIAIGMLNEPHVCVLYQQLHSYPPGVGNKITDSATGQKRDEKSLGLERTKQGKWRITPVSRELLSGIDGYIALADNDVFEGQVRDGLSGGVSRVRPDGKARYGVPFLGDNSYLIDRLSEHLPHEVKPARWYCLLNKETAPDVPEARPGTCRMTYQIDREDMSRTKSELYAPQRHATTNIPDAAWTRIGSVA